MTCLNIDCCVYEIERERERECVLAMYGMVGPVMPIYSQTEKHYCSDGISFTN